MPRTTIDQALITGLSFTANHALASLVQESLQSAAFLFTGDAGRGVLDERRWSRATIAVDAARNCRRATACNRVLRQDRRNGQLPRGGSAHGWLLDRDDRRRRHVDRWLAGSARSSERRPPNLQFVVVPAAAGLAIGGEVLRRRRSRLDDQHTGTDTTEMSGSQSCSSMGLGRGRRNGDVGG